MSDQTQEERWQGSENEKDRIIAELKSRLDDTRDIIADLKGAVELLRDKLARRNGDRTRLHIAATASAELLAGLKAAVSALESAAAFIDNSIASDETDRAIGSARSLIEKYSGEPT